MLVQRLRVLAASCLCTFVLLASMTFIAQEVRADTRIIGPASQSLTFATQTAGTFSACADDDADSQTCSYQEGDQANGHSHSIVGIVDGSGTAQNWAATGCSEGSTEWQCVDDGPTHDSDTTYLSSATHAQNECTTIENDAEWAVAGTTITDVTMWMYARFVAGANADPDVLSVIAYDTDGCDTPNCSDVPWTADLTSSYANFTNSNNVCAPWTTSTLNSLVAAFEVVCTVPPCDTVRVTSIGYVVDLTHPNWRSEVIYNYVNVLKTADLTLNVRAAVPADSESVLLQVYDWLIGAYVTQQTMTSTSQTTYLYTLSEYAEVSNDGDVRIRFLDNTINADENRGTLVVDAAFIVSVEATTTGGGGDLGELIALSCNQNFNKLHCSVGFTREVAGVEILDTQWYVNGNFAGRGRSVTADTHDATLSFFPVPAGDANVSVQVFFSNGQMLTLSETAHADNSWLVLIIFLGLFAILLIVFVRRGVRAVRPKRAPQSGHNWRLDLYKGRPKE